MNDCATKARKSTDMYRAAIAFMRAVRDERSDDQLTIISAVWNKEDLYFFIMFLAYVGLRDGELTDEDLAGLLERVNEIDFTGKLEEVISLQEDPEE